MNIPTSGPPAEIAELARRREEARARRDFATADALKSEIEAAGWRVVDRGGRSSLVPAAPATAEVGGETRYGSASATPSRLEEPPDARWTVVMAVSEDAAGTSRLLAALRRHSPAGTRVVIVANDPSGEQAAALAPGGPDRAPIHDREPEILRTSTRLGFAAALNIALRRVSGELVLMADGRAWPAGDAFTPIEDVLADPDVAAAGAFGLVSAEPGRLRPSSLETSDGPNPHALLGPWLAFRRSDLIELGPLDEHFVVPAWLDIWWSLRLRNGSSPTLSPVAEAVAGAEELEAAEPSAEGETSVESKRSLVEAPDFGGLELPPPRRAVRLALPLESATVDWPPDRTRLARRNMYRVLDDFGWRSELFEDR